MLIVELYGRDVNDGAVTIPQTASEWLLARFDRTQRRAFGPHGDGRRIRYERGSNFDRRIFDLLDDHPGSQCMLDEHDQCVAWSGEAAWPIAALGDDIDDDASIDALFVEIA